MPATWTVECSRSKQASSRHVFDLKVFLLFSWLSSIRFFRGAGCAWTRLTALTITTFLALCSHDQLAIAPSRLSEAKQGYLQRYIDGSILEEIYKVLRFPFCRNSCIAGD